VHPVFRPLLQLHLRKTREFREALSRQISSAVPCLDTREFSLVTCQNVIMRRKPAIKPVGYRWRACASAAPPVLARRHMPLGIMLCSHRTIHTQSVTPIQLERFLVRQGAAKNPLFAPATRHALHGDGGEKIRKLG